MSEYRVLKPGEPASTYVDLEDALRELGVAFDKEHPRLSPQLRRKFVGRMAVDLRELQKANDILRAEVAGLENQLGDAQLQTHTWRQAAEKKSAHANKLLADAARVRTLRTIEQTTIEELRDQVELLSTTLDARHVTIDELRAEVAKQKNLTSVATTLLNTEIGKTNSLQHSLARADNVNNVLRQQLEQRDVKYKRATQDIAELHRRVAEAKRITAEVLDENRVPALVTALATSESEAEELTRTNAHLAARLSSSDQDLVEALADLADLAQQLGERDQDLATALADVEQVNEERATLAEQWERLRHGQMDLAALEVWMRRNGVLRVDFDARFAGSEWGLGVKDLPFHLMKSSSLANAWTAIEQEREQRTQP